VCNQANVPDFAGKTVFNMPRLALNKTGKIYSLSAPFAFRKRCACHCCNKKRIIVKAMLAISHLTSTFHNSFGVFVNPYDIISTKSVYPIGYRTFSINV
jgi:hypothetical protein